MKVIVVLSCRALIMYVYHMHGYSNACQFVVCAEFLYTVFE